MIAFLFLSHSEDRFSGPQNDRVFLAEKGEAPRFAGHFALFFQFSEPFGDNCLSLGLDTIMLGRAFDFCFPLLCLLFFSSLVSFMSFAYLDARANMAAVAVSVSIGCAVHKAVLTSLAIAAPHTLASNLCAGDLIIVVVGIAFDQEAKKFAS